MTIKQNILFGHEGAVSSSHFREVCRMAECDEFVSRLPLAYDTPIRGCVLSGGQKQRIGRLTTPSKSSDYMLNDYKQLREPFLENREF